ncbi:MAG: glycosyl hydrolase, partial [Bacteroidota bacterium]
MSVVSKIPGDQQALETVHPSYDLSQARPEAFSPKVGGMDFLSDGRMVISTWDADGGIYILDGVQNGDPSEITYKKIASGLAEPLGVKVVEDTIYVLQKQELTKLIDHDGDDIIDEYYTLSNAWKVSANFHEFAFGLAFKDDWFYGTLAIAILPGGASAQPQIPDRGKMVRIRRSDGKTEFVAQGLRTPNGIGLGVDNEIFVADNQGDWLPACKILHMTPGSFYNSRAVNPVESPNWEVKQPVVWLPQDEIGNSPTTPLLINDGPYAGQMIHGEVTHGGVKRVFVEKVNGEYQGAVFRFIQGLEAGVNRMVWGPDDALYIGGIGSTGNWRQNGKLWYGLQRLKYNEASAFEMLAVRAKSNGIEIELTEPLPEHVGWDASEYE